MSSTDLLWLFYISEVVWGVLYEAFLQMPNSNCDETKLASVPWTAITFVLILPFTNEALNMDECRDKWV